METLDELKKGHGAIEKRLGYSFHDKELLSLAFIHRSFINENRDIIEGHNERLEFLGDSVLGLIVAEYLYKYLPKTPEGELSHLRSMLVESTSCMRYVQLLNVEGFILLGRGERMNDGRGRDSILSDLFEAIIGAIFIDGGIDAARGFFFKNFSKEINQMLQKPLQNWKALLQDFSQKQFRTPPVYSVVSESGPDHNKTFKIIVKIKGDAVGSGEGSSKKEAQQNAARDAVEKLGVLN